MLMKIVIIVLAVGAIAVVLAVFIGEQRWASRTRSLLTHMEEVRIPGDVTRFDSEELAGLPQPVQRFFRTVLVEGQPIIAAVQVKHTGTFNMSESGEQWTPFTSDQRVVTRRPGFTWDARIRMAPGLTVFVHDAYVAGRGMLTARILGLVTVMEQPPSAELDQGEFIRFFAEGAWYPTALLPSQGVQWEAIDDDRARATLADGRTRVSLEFQFNEQGLIIAVYSKERFRAVSGTNVATLWQGRFWNYERRDGMLVPLEGEVAWLLTDGPKPYWRGRIKEMSFEYHR